MKLNKNKLIKITKIGLKDLGYKEIKDTITGAQGLYIKKIKTDFYLTLGLTISRYYDTLFTASFYLSKITTWSAVWGDIPRNSYQRIGHFLTNDERNKFLNKEYSQEGVRDAWWNTDDQFAINHFLESVKITEKRFLDQQNLFSDIEESEDVKELSKMAAIVIEKVNIGEINEYAFKFTPQKPIDNISLEWFKASEKVINEKNAILNINTVKRLAADAYRQNLI